MKTKPKSSVPKEKIKAFLDDLALIQKKHQLCVKWDHYGTLIEKTGDTKSGANTAADISNRDTDGWEWKLVNWGDEKLVRKYKETWGDVLSEDFENMSAHDLILYKRKQKE